MGGSDTPGRGETSDPLSAGGSPSMRVRGCPPVSMTVGVVLVRPVSPTALGTAVARERPGSVLD
jgi:hypothetical protein